MTAFGRFRHRPFLADCTHSMFRPKAAVQAAFGMSAAPCQPFVMQRYFDTGGGQDSRPGRGSRRRARVDGRSLWSAAQGQQGGRQLNAQRFGKAGAGRRQPARTPRSRYGDGSTSRADSRRNDFESLLLTVDCRRNEARSLRLTADCRSHEVESRGVTVKLGRQ